MQAIETTPLEKERSELSGQVEEKLDTVSLGKVQTCVLMNAFDL